MTELFAVIKDLRLVRGGEWCSFRISHADEFPTTLKSLKARILLEDREWDEAKKLWRVRLTPRTERMLERVFDNFSSSLETLRTQQRLWQ